MFLSNKAILALLSILECELGLKKKKNLLNLRTQPVNPSKTEEQEAAYQPTNGYR